MAISPSRARSVLLEAEEVLSKAEPVVALVDRFELDLNGERRDVPRTAGTALPALVLDADGTATEYCRLFAAAE